MYHVYLILPGCQIEGGIKKPSFTVEHDCSVESRLSIAIGRRTFKVTRGFNHLFLLALHGVSIQLIIQFVFL